MAGQERGRRSRMPDGKPKICKAVIGVNEIGQNIFCPQPPTVQAWIEMPEYGPALPVDLCAMHGAMTEIHGVLLNG